MAKSNPKRAAKKPIKKHKNKSKKEMSSVISGSLDVPSGSKLLPPIFVPNEVYARLENIAKKRSCTIRDVIEFSINEEIMFDFQHPEGRLGDEQILELLKAKKKIQEIKDAHQ